MQELGQIDRRTCMFEAEAKYDDLDHRHVRSCAHPNRPVRDSAPAALSAGPGTGGKLQPVQSHETSGSVKPNIIIVMADQVHAGLTKRSGFLLDVMPMLDSISDQGVSFDRAYACAPLCVPSRVSRLTGRWPHAHVFVKTARVTCGVRARSFRDSERSRIQNWACGKNHSYLKPVDLDFWREYGHSSGWKPKNASKDVVEFDHWLTNFHHGIGPDYDKNRQRVRSNYLGMLRLIHDQLKRLVGFLDTRQLRQNTIVVYLTDYGAYFTDYGMIHTS